MKRAPGNKLADNAMIFATADVRIQLKLIAALTDSTMKEVLTCIVAAELKRVDKARGRVKS
jgi:hypothetical protein